MVPPMRPTDIGPTRLSQACDRAGTGPLTDSQSVHERAMRQKRAGEILGGDRRQWVAPRVSRSAVQQGGFVRRATSPQHGAGKPTRNDAKQSRERQVAENAK